jgi:hypothetical protein
VLVINQRNEVKNGRSADVQGMLENSILWGGADKSLAQPTSRCCNTESTVSLERGLFMCQIASLFLFQGLKGSMSTLRCELSSRFFSCKARHRRKFTPFWQKH